MNYEEFFKKYDGIEIPGQCVGLVKQYLKEVLNITENTIISAKDFYLKYGKIDCLKENFTQIAMSNTKPQKGDIVVWDETHGGNNGHVAIATGKSDESSFYCYDQNWPNNYRATHLQYHTYEKSIYGVLRPNDKTNIYNTSILDLDLYRSLYSDLSSMSDFDLLNHFFTSGLNEGRRASYVFDTPWYREKNSDLNSMSNFELYEHFVSYGINEGRQCCLEFNPKYYIQNNSDLNSLSNEQAFNHFLNTGINEFRYTSNDFNVVRYRDGNSDLKSAFGNNCKAYYKHWICGGKNENRVH